MSFFGQITDTWQALVDLVIRPPRHEYDLVRDLGQRRSGPSLRLPTTKPGSRARAAPEPAFLPLPVIYACSSHSTHPPCASVQQNVWFLFRASGFGVQRVVPGVQNPKSGRTPAAAAGVSGFGFRGAAGFRPDFGFWTPTRRPKGGSVSSAGAGGGMQSLVAWSFAG